MKGVIGHPPALTGAAPLQPRYILGVLLLLFACSTPEAPVAARLQAAEHATLATVAELGSYALSSEVTRTWTSKTGQLRSNKQTSELQWEDPDQWSFQLSRGDRVVQRVVVFGGQPWVSTGSQPMSRQGDAEPYRVQLSAAWDPWNLALDQVREQIQLSELRNDTLDGREVMIFKVGIKALPEKARPAWRATSAEGQVWIDRLTSVRLKGEMTVQAEGKQENLEIRFLFQLSHIGEAVSITDPAQEAGSRLELEDGLPETARPARPAPPVPRPAPRTQ